MIFWETGLLSGNIAGLNSIIAVIGALMFFGAITGLADPGNGKEGLKALAACAVLMLFGICGALLLIVIIMLDVAKRVGK